MPNAMTPVLVPLGDLPKHGDMILGPLLGSTLFPCIRMQPKPAPIHKHQSLTTTFPASRIRPRTGCVSAWSWIQQQPSLSAFTNVIRAAGGLASIESATAPVTVFAPSNAAWPAVATALNTDPDALYGQVNTLTRIAGYQVVPGAPLDPAQLAAKRQLVTGTGDPIFVTAGDSGISLQGYGSSAQVVAPSLASGCNWVVHGIDTVLLPMAGVNGINPAYTSAFVSAAG